MITRLSDLTKELLGTRDSKPLDIEEYPIRKVLFKGTITDISYKVNIEKIFISELGTTSVIFENYTCPRCHKNEGHLALEGKVSMYFCADDKCLQDDARYYKTTVKFTHLLNEH